MCDMSGGEKVRNVLVVPSPEEEDARQMHREMVDCGGNASGIATGSSPCL